MSHTGCPFGHTQYSVLFVTDKMSGDDQAHSSPVHNCFREFHNDWLTAGAHTNTRYSKQLLGHESNKSCAVTLLVTYQHSLRLHQKVYFSLATAQHDVVMCMLHAHSQLPVAARAHTKEEKKTMHLNDGKMRWKYAAIHSESPMR